MYLKFHNIEKIPNGTSFNLLIKGVNLYNDGKFIQSFKLTSELIKLVESGKIEIDPNDLK